MLYFIDFSVPQVSEFFIVFKMQCLEWRIHQISFIMWINVTRSFSLIGLYLFSSNCHAYYEIIKETVSVIAPITIQ